MRFCIPVTVGLVLSTIVIVILALLGITTIDIPNAFFLLAALAVLSILLFAVQTLYYSGCNKNNRHYPFFIRFIRCLNKTFLWALALLIYAVVLSFFVTAGTLVISIGVLWIGLFLLITLLVSAICEMT